jgi:hypothetical protein
MRGIGVRLGRRRQSSTAPSCQLSFHGGAMLWPHEPFAMELARRRKADDQGMARSSIGRPTAKMVASTRRRRPRCRRIGRHAAMI